MPAPAGGTTRADGTSPPSPVWQQPEFMLGALTYSTYLLGSLSAAVRGLSFVPVLVLLLLVVLRPGRFRAPPALVLFMVGFLGFYLASYVFSTRTDYSHFKIAMMWLKVLPLMLIPCFLRDSYRAYFAGVLAVLLAFMLVASVRSLVQARVVSINQRLDFGVFNSIWIARAAFECLLIAMVILRRPRNTVLAIFAMALLVTYVAGSKGPLLSFLVAIAFWKLVDPALRRAHRVIAIATVVAVPVILFVASTRILDAESYLVQRFLRAVPEGSSQVVQEESRLFTWPITVAKIAGQDPMHLLFGQGVGNYGSFYFGQQYSERTYPHNIILEFAAEQGLLFTALLIGFVAWLLARFRTDFRVLLVFTLMNAMFSGDIPLNEYIFFYLAWTLVIGRPGTAGGASRTAAPRVPAAATPLPLGRA